MADILGLNPAQAAMLVGLAALLYAILRWRKNMLDRQRARTNVPGAVRGAGDMPAGSHRPALSMREVNSEVQALLADVEETARRLAAQLDNRYTRMEQLLAEADEKIRRLEALTRSAGGNAGEGARADHEPAVTDAQRTLSRLRQERGAPPATEDPAYQPIYALADRGKTSREIAQELGRQPGEIELILALRGRT